MTMRGRPAATNRLIERVVEMWRAASGRQIAAVACLALLAGVAFIGIFHSLGVPAGGQPSATGVLSASSTVGSVWGSGDSTGAINWVDLMTKGLIVLALLFVTLRVMGRMGTGAPKRGNRLEVLESRPLAPKASLHLVAVGDRRLVIGLTPSGMVSLAELDAAELETEDATATADEFSEAADGAGRASRPAQPTFGSSVTSVLWPVDALTGRLATFLNGGRVR